MECPLSDGYDVTLTSPSRYRGARMHLLVVVIEVSGLACSPTIWRYSMPWWSGLLCDRYQSPVSLVPRAFACTCWGHRSEWPSMSYQASRCDGGIQCLPAAVAVSRVIISCNGVKTSTSGHIVTTLLLNPAQSNHAKWCFHWAVKLFFELLDPKIIAWFQRRW